MPLYKWICLKESEIRSRGHEIWLKKENGKKELLKLLRKFFIIYESVVFFWISMLQTQTPLFSFFWFAGDPSFDSSFCCSSSLQSCFVEALLDSDLGHHQLCNAYKSQGDDWYGITKACYLVCQEMRKEKTTFRLNGNKLVTRTISPRSLSC